MVSVLYELFTVIIFCAIEGETMEMYKVDIDDQVNLACIFDIKVPSNTKFSYKLIWEGPSNESNFDREGDKGTVAELINIGKINDDHEGIYQCTVVFSLSWQPEGKDASYRVFKTIRTLSSVIISLKPETRLIVQQPIAEVTEGKNAEWRIELPPGETRSGLTWTTYEHANVDPRRYKINSVTSASSSNLRLVLLKATDLDPKLYFVYMKNGTLRVSLQLVVLRKSVLVEPLQNEIGQRFEAQCAVPGSSLSTSTSLKMYYDRCANYVHKKNDCVTFTDEEVYEFKDLRYPASVTTNLTAERTGIMYCDVREPEMNATFGEQWVCVTDVLDGLVIETPMRVLGEKLIPINATDVIEGDTILLTCRMSYCDTLYKVRHVEWFFKNEQPLQNLFLIGNSSATAQILLTNIKGEEMDRYFCKSTPTTWKMIDLSFNAPNSLAKNLAIGISVVVAILLIALLTFLYFRNKRRKEDEERNRKALAIFQQGDVEAIDFDIPLSEQAELLPFGPEWYFPRDKLKLGKILGSGFFGMVMEAEAEEILKGEENTTVAVKTVKRHADPELLRALGKEVKIMANLGSHPFIVNLLGAVVDRLAKGELLMIVEFCRFGCLLNYLQKNRSRFVNLTSKQRDQTTVHSYQNEPDLPPFDSNVLLEWCYQIARGMEYLAGKRIVHCDLAARNILVAEDNIVKICDFGLAHDLYKKEEYIKDKGLALPLRWMAMESIKDRVFSSVTDVWSFGVVLWEIFTIGNVPYMEFELFDQAWDYINRGDRLKMPEYATKSIYNVMLSCWNADPKTRPTFTELTNKLLVELSITQRNQYIKLEEDFQFIGTGRREVEGYVQMTGKVGEDNPLQNAKSRLGNLFTRAVALIPNYYNVFNLENHQRDPQERFVKTIPDILNKPLIKVTSEDASQASREELADFRLSTTADINESDQIDETSLIELTKEGQMLETAPPTLKHRKYVKTPEVTKPKKIVALEEKDPIVVPHKRSEESIILPKRSPQKQNMQKAETGPLSLQSKETPKCYINTDAEKVTLPEGYTIMSPQVEKAPEINPLELPPKPASPLPEPYIEIQVKKSPFPDGYTIMSPQVDTRVSSAEINPLELPPKPASPLPEPYVKKSPFPEGYTIMSPQVDARVSSAEINPLELPPKPTPTLPEGYLEMSPLLNTSDGPPGYVEMTPSKVPHDDRNLIPQKRTRQDMDPRKPKSEDLSVNLLPLMPRARNYTNPNPEVITGIENQNFSFTSQDGAGIYDTVPPTATPTNESDEPPPLPNKSAKITEVGSLMVKSREGGKLHYEKPRIL